ncbi:hypothetical protein yc1106_05189 [Curvularia clavata]|uniref:Kinesin motor domain-containing protein n=1 Tax=Curvularia clavata TaxID=95742 RepID=A0A9Q8ZA15_CURCL|nr:hypothetical protein yc1106_05189 [Curvularia clavata]
MTETNSAPHTEGDPAAMPDANETRDQDTNEHKPRDSNGWDGKLRVDRMTLADEPRDPHAQIESDPEASEDEGPPPEQLAADEDLLDDVPDDEEEIELVHCKISDMSLLRLERFKQMKRLCLRQNRIESIAIPEDLASTLTEVDLYDNLIAHIKGLDAFTELTSLDLSFNKIKHIKRLSHMTKLKDLYFVQNKISTIENLEGLSNLRQIELGANRVREIQGLETLTGLEELWLGKNKITEIKGLDTLTNLKILSIQSNRLRSITGLEKLVNLEELHISHNLLTDLSGLENNVNLSVIDISANPIEHLSGLKSLKHLTEFWASNCKLSDFGEIERELKDKEQLETVYFEGNPLQRSQPALYRNKVKLALPQVVQIDAIPEPAYKQRRTQTEPVAEPPSRRIPAPSKISNGLKPPAPRSLAASTSRALSKPAVKNTSVSAYGSSVGATPRPAAIARPKSAYGQTTHARSKSYHQGSRPATSMMHRAGDDDSDQADRKGGHTFLISSTPFTMSSDIPSIPPPRTVSQDVSRGRVAQVPKPRTVSSPCSFHSVTPVIEDPTDPDCNSICKQIGALTLGASKAEEPQGRLGRGMTSDNGINPFLKPKLPPSKLRQPTQTPVRQPQMNMSPWRPMSTTPRRSAPPPFLNRFTNDRCPDFYNERIEAMERDFRSFKEKMEMDVQQATDYKETIQQLQGRVTELETIRARLEIVNKGLESELDDTRSSLKSVKMELDMAQQKHTYEVDDVRRRLRNEVEDLESRHRKDTDRLERERDELERKTRSEFEARIDKLLKQHEEELQILRKKLDSDSEAERSRRAQEAQKIEEEYASKLRAAALDADVKQREAQLLQGELTNVKSELDRERILKNGLQNQLTEATTLNLTLEATNKAMKEKIDFLESDSQAQSTAFNDLHKRMQDAIEAAERAHDKLRQEETLRRKLFNQVQELKGNIRVMCRVRPAHATESHPAQISFPDTDTDSKEVAILGPSKQSATGKDITAAYSYSFDRVFGPASQNGEVFEEISQLVQSALDGYNVCIFCYGQTGSGKTHTMSSADGMIPRATAQIWDEAQRLQEKGWQYTMEGSFIEVYNEQYNDLLGRSEDLDKKKVEVRHDPVKKQTNLDNAVSVKLDGPGRVEEILETASKNRTVAATKANMRSSRSHSVFILRLVGHNAITGERSEGTLNLVDLAGSERLEHSKVEGARLKETQNINKSLSCLGDVINALGSAKEGGHIPYRNSKLTYLLQYSLGGNSKTLMFVMVSPLQAHLQETITSLKFATKVHNTHIGTAKKQTKA